MPLPPAAPRRVGAESLALDVARMTSLAFFVSARDREFSFQSCADKRRGGGGVHTPVTMPPAHHFRQGQRPRREGAGRPDHNESKTQTQRFKKLLHTYKYGLVAFCPAKMQDGKTRPRETNGR